MKTFVINLATRPERLAHMREALGAAGIDFERFDAIDTVRSEEHARRTEIRPIRSGRAWYPFEIAVLLSHLTIWNRIVDEGDEHAAIFEDDVIVSKDLRRILDGDFPPDSDIIKLETVLQVVYLGRRYIPMSTGTGGFRRLHSVHEGAGAYVISRRAAAALRLAVLGFGEPIDRALFSPELTHDLGLRMYQAVPAHTIQGVIVPSAMNARVMESDRTKSPGYPPPGGHSRDSGLLQRVLRRGFNQLRWIRTIVPFAEAIPQAPEASI